MTPRRQFLRRLGIQATSAALLAGTPFRLDAADPSPQAPSQAIDPLLAREWLARWNRNILSNARARYCDREMGEELGWKMSPFLEGFYYGFRATGDARWVSRLVDWADAWIRRGRKEPDGFIGWPKSGSGGTASENFLSDSLLGEAMTLRPVVLMAAEILKDPEFKKTYGSAAESYLSLAEQIFQKWDTRGCWREVKAGGLWVEPPFGLDPKTGQWTEGYDQRKTDGFSHPANKQNLIARGLTALHDATKKPIYRERAEQWWRLMKSRIKTCEEGKYFVWNYWDPAGPWDYNPDRSPKHWVGVHPNGGYYGIDVAGIVDAYEHNLVFTKEDLDKLIATNRDFMWNQQVKGAKFQRIDGREPDARWKESPGTLWAALAPYDAKLCEVFVANHNPSDWGALGTTPWFLARFRASPESKEPSQRSRPQQKSTPAIGKSHE